MHKYGEPQNWGAPRTLKLITARLTLETRPSHMCYSPLDEVYLAGSLRYFIQCTNAIIVARFAHAVNWAIC